MLHFTDEMGVESSPAGMGLANEALVAMMEPIDGEDLLTVDSYTQDFHSSVIVSANVSGLILLQFACLFLEI